MFIAVFSLFSGILFTHEGAIFLIGAGVLACSRYFLWALIAALFFILGVWRVQPFLHLPQVPARYLNRPVAVVGIIDSIPTHLKYGRRFVFQLQRVATFHTTARAKLSWYGYVPSIEVGDQWRLQVKLKQPPTHIGIERFNYRRYLQSHAISLEGYVLHQHHFVTHEAHFERVRQFRESIQRLITQSIHNPLIAAMVAALTVGSRVLLRPIEWHVFQATGTNHLVAISGLHIGLMAGFGLLLAMAGVRRLPSLMRRMPAQKLAALVALLFAFSYALLAGFALPTQRAVIMIAVLLIGEWLQRPSTVWQRLLVAMLLVLLLDPLSYLSASFWLSFGAVASIAYGALTVSRVRFYRLQRWWQMQKVMTLGLLPFTLWFFQFASGVSIAANFIAIPWVGFVIVPLCLLSVVVAFFSCGLAHWGFYLVGKLLWPLWWYLHWLAQFHHSIWRHLVATRGILGLTLLGVLGLLAPKGLPLKWFGLLCLLPFLLMRPPRPAWGQVWVKHFEAKRHRVVLYMTAKHTLAYVTGQHTLPILFRQAGFKHVIYLGRDIPCKLGRMWVWDGVQFRVISARCQVAVT